jgi:hypothetical protein
LIEIVPLIKEFKQKYEPWYNKKMKEIQDEWTQINEERSGEEDTKEED